MRVVITVDKTKTPPSVRVGVENGAAFPEAEVALQAFAQKLGASGIEFTSEPRVEAHRHDDETEHHVTYSEHRHD